MTETVERPLIFHGTQMVEGERCDRLKVRLVLLFDASIRPARGVAVCRAICILARSLAGWQRRQASIVQTFSLPRSPGRSLHLKSAVPPTDRPSEPVERCRGRCGGGGDLAVPIHPDRPTDQLDGRPIPFHQLAGCMVGCPDADMEDGYYKRFRGRRLHAACNQEQFSGLGAR